MSAVDSSRTGPARGGSGPGLRGGLGDVRVFVAVLAASPIVVLGTSDASAATATSTMSVTATVQASCSVSASPLAFGTYVSAEVDATTTLSVTCTNTTPYNVGIDAGGGTGATVSSRKMMNGSNALAYGLFQDSGHTAVWGTSIGGNTVAGTGTGAAQSLTVYGAITSGQTPAPGSYSDTVTVTVSY